MPMTLQIERLALQLGEHLDEGSSIVSADLYDLQGAELRVALDAVVAHEPSPFVLVDGQLVCTGAVEVDAVLGALT